MRIFAALVALVALALQPAALRAEELRFEPVRSIMGELLIPSAEAATGEPAAKGALTNGRALAIGLGAIAGVVAVNYAMGGFMYVPGMAAYASAEQVAAASAASAQLAANPAILATTVAVSRVIAVSSAAVGGFIGNMLYGQ
jgi:hypothetical protein